MEPFSTASVLAIAGKLVTAEVTKTAIAGIKRQLQPDEMAVVLLLNDTELGGSRQLSALSYLPISTCRDSTDRSRKPYISTEF